MRYGANAITAVQRSSLCSTVDCAVLCVLVTGCEERGVILATMCAKVCAKVCTVLNGDLSVDVVDLLFAPECRGQQARHGIARGMYSVRCLYMRPYITPYDDYFL